MGTIKFFVSRIFLVLSFLIIFSSCFTSNLQTAAIKAPEAKTIAHLAKDDYQTRLTIRPYYFNNIDKRLEFNTGTHTDVNSDRIYQLDPTEDEDFFIERNNVNVYEFDVKNLIWNRPLYSAGFDLEYTVSGKIVTLGLQYGRVENQDFLSGLFGFSFFLEKAFRVGINIYFQSTTYDGLVMHVEDKFSSGQRDVEIGKINGKEGFTDIDLYLSWRSHFKKYMPFDIFIEGATGTQTLIDANHVAKDEFLFNSSQKMYYKDDFTSLTFGIFRDINENSKIITGYKMNFHNDEYSNLYIKTNSFFIQYEYDFILTE